MASRPSSSSDPASTDDEVEIKIVPAATPPPRRRRTPNPAVDDVIHSGEIVESRSRVVRASGEMSKVEVSDDTEPRPALPAAPRRKLRLLWLVAAIVPGVAAGALLLIDSQASPAAAQNDSARVGLA